MTNEKLTQLIVELEEELCFTNEDIDAWEAIGFDPSGFDYCDDAFYAGKEEGELYERSFVLSKVLMRLKGVVQ